MNMNYVIQQHECAVNGYERSEIPVTEPNGEDNKAYDLRDSFKGDKCALCDREMNVFVLHGKVSGDTLDIDVVHN